MNTQNNSRNTGRRPAVALQRRVRRRRPRAGETWKFEMQAPSGRMVWWTRKLTHVTAEGCYWHEPRRWLRSCTSIAVVQSGRLISPNDMITNSRAQR